MTTAGLPPQVIAAGAAGILTVYLLNRGTNDRLVRAFSGTGPPDLVTEPATAQRIIRRTSWEGKFEGNEASKTMESSVFKMEQALNDGAESRLKRRPSYATLTSSAQSHAS